MRRYNDIYENTPKPYLYKMAKLGEPVSRPSANWANTRGSRNNPPSRHPSAAKNFISPQTLLQAHKTQSARSVSDARAHYRPSWTAEHPEYSRDRSPLREARVSNQ